MKKFGEWSSEERIQILLEILRGKNNHSLLDVCRFSENDDPDRLENSILAAFYEVCAEQALQKGEGVMAAEFARRGRIKCKLEKCNTEPFFQLEAMGLAQSGSKKEAAELLRRLTKISGEEKSIISLAQTLRDMALIEPFLEAKWRLFQEGMLYTRDAFAKYPESYLIGSLCSQFAFFAAETDRIGNYLKQVRDLCRQDAKDTNALSELQIETSLGEAALIEGNVNGALKHYTAITLFEDEFPADTEAARAVARSLISHRHDPEPFEPLLEVLKPCPEIGVLDQHSPSKAGMSQCKTVKRSLPDEAMWISLGEAMDAWKNGDGDGVKIAVLDSGVDTSHPELENFRLLDDLAFIEEEGKVKVVEGNGEDNYGHGTAVASIIRGIAPKAEIGSFRVLGRNLQGKGEVVRTAVNHAMGKGYHILNCSFGFSGRKKSGELQYVELHKEWLDEAYLKNIHVVTTCNNINFKKTEWPGYFATSISVDKAHCHEDEFFYRPGTLVEFAAKGYGMRVPWINHSWKEVDGSSYAAPRVAGKIAALLSIYPFLSPPQLKALLRHIAIERPYLGGSSL